MDECVAFDKANPAHAERLAKAAAAAAAAAAASASKSSKSSKSGKKKAAAISFPEEDVKESDKARRREADATDVREIVTDAVGFEQLHAFLTGEYAVENINVRIAPAVIHLSALCSLSL